MNNSVRQCVYCWRSVPIDFLIEIPGSRNYDREPRYMCTTSTAECQRLTRERTVEDENARRRSRYEKGTLKTDWPFP